MDLVLRVGTWQYSAVSCSFSYIFYAALEYIYFFSALPGAGVFREEMLGAESQNMFDFYDNHTGGGDHEDSDIDISVGDDGGEQFVLPPRSVQLAGEESTEAEKSKSSTDRDGEMRVTSKTVDDPSGGSETDDVTRGGRGTGARFQSKSKSLGDGITLSLPREQIMMDVLPALDPRSSVPSRTGTTPLLPQSERQRVQHTMSPHQSSERGADVTHPPHRLATHDDTVSIGGLKLPAGVVIQKKKKKKKKERKE